MIPIKAHLMDAAAIDRALMRISHEIMEKEADASEIILIGIQRRGVPMAEQIAKNIRAIGALPVTVGTLDISLYRDDLQEIADRPIFSEPPSLPMSIDGKHVILVDDVIYTGRTTRAAMDALMDLGRPSAIRLAILIDRGHRELPIRPDFVGKNIPTSSRELVDVQFPPIDAEKQVLLLEAEEQSERKLL